MTMWMLYYCHVTIITELLPTHEEITTTLDSVTSCDNTTSKSRVSYTRDKLTQNQYCRAHLNQAISLNETAERDYSFCRTLRTNDDVFQKILSQSQAEYVRNI